MFSSAPFDRSFEDVGLRDHGHLLVPSRSVRPVRLRALDRDVLLFPRGPGRVSAGEEVLRGRSRFVDPLSAVWCPAGEALEIRAGSDGSAETGRPVRFDWLAVATLAAGHPEVTEIVRRLVAERALRGARGAGLILPLPPAFYLGQRMLCHGGRSEPAATVGAGEWRPGPIGRCLQEGREGRRGPSERAGLDELVRRGREVLCRTFRETRPVGRIADELGCSDGHLSRVFKRGTGLTLLGYRHELRMRSALDRLDPIDPMGESADEDGGDDLAALADELGYASHSHFTARFERTFGLTPSVYRRMARGWGVE